MTITITYPIVLPSAPLPARSKVRMLTATALTESPFDFTAQAFLHQGARWAIDLQYPPMRRAKAELFITAFAKLQGRYGTFLAGDYDGRAPRGIATGTPLVNGGSQTGNNLITDGWTINKTGIVKAGDYIQLGSGSTARLYKVLDDANSDGSGNATFLIWPNLRVSPANNDPLTLVNTVTQFRLDTPFEWDADQVSNYGFSISASEAL